MRFPFPLAGRRVEGLNANTSVALTEEGKRMAETQTSSGATFAIVSSLDERSPQMVREVAADTQIDMPELKKRMEILIKGGLVRTTSGD